MFKIELSEFSFSDHVVLKSSHIREKVEYCAHMKKHWNWQAVASGSVALMQSNIWSLNIFVFAMVFKGQDAWRKHPLLTGCHRTPFPHFGLAVKVFAFYLVAECYVNFITGKLFFVNNLIVNVVYSDSILSILSFSTSSFSARALCQVCHEWKPVPCYQGKGQSRSPLIVVNK